MVLCYQSEAINSQLSTTKNGDFSTTTNVQIITHWESSTEETFHKSPSLIKLTRNFCRLNGGGHGKCFSEFIVEIFTLGGIKTHDTIFKIFGIR